MDLNKKNLTPKQWKHLALTRINGEYGKHYQIYTDASKHKNGNVGIGVTDCKKIRSMERLSSLFQITSAELVAFLKALLYCEENRNDHVVILTDSLMSCKWIRYGLTDNYLVHLIREQVHRLDNMQVLIQWIPSHWWN